MREVEIKAHVKDETLLREKLKKADIALSKLIVQHDEVFGLPKVVEGRRTGELAEGDATSPWLRIRTEKIAGDTTIYITLKKSQDVHLDKIEHEFKINDAEAAKAVIETLGMISYSSLKKTRQQGQINGLTICIDKVEGLGVFVELEKITKDNTPYEQIANELWDVLETLGVHRACEVMKGYDVLQQELQ